MQRIQDSELAQYGISTSHHKMENGERRFRLTGADGSAYIRTEAAPGGGWQNSHYHTALSELYLVQRGWMLFAELEEGGLSVERYGAGEFCVSRPMVPHNVYMGPGAVLHTIKFGDCSRADWQKSEALDELLPRIELPVGAAAQAGEGEQNGIS